MSSTPPAQTQVTVAATAFLNTLSAERRGKVQFAFASQPAATAAKFKGGMGGRMTFLGEQYGQAVWSNFPVSDVARPGVYNLFKNNLFMSLFYMNTYTIDTN